MLFFHTHVSFKCSIIARADAFERYQKYTGGVQDKNTDLLRITPEQYKNLKSLYFNIGGVRSARPSHLARHESFVLTSDATR